MPGSKTHTIAWIWSDPGNYSHLKMRMDYPTRPHCYMHALVTEAAFLKRPMDAYQDHNDLVSGEMKFA